VNPPRLGLFGYGEVGHGLALGLRAAGLASIAAYQRMPHSALTQERARASGVRLVSTSAELADVADLILAVTQGSEALNAARSIQNALRAHHCYVDLASATPRTKREIGEVLAPSSARVADGAIEGSPLEHQHRFPVIVSGPGAAFFAEAMTPWGMRIAVVGEELGKAAAIKGLRHILMKGQIALLVECAVAAKRYGIRDEVLASVAEWYDALPFMTNASRVLRTTTVHAARRAEEAGMARAILEELGLEPVMTRATVTLLDRIAKLELRERLGGVPPESHEAALDLMEGVLRT
jgi:3-hydroxyisobutyrate dehydrogenase-like beta-hydroxyacid dehydrogenase